MRAAARSLLQHLLACSCIRCSPLTACLLLHPLQPAHCLPAPASAAARSLLACSCRVRFEGCSAWNGCTVADIVWEMTFCPTTNTMMLCVDVHARLTGQAGASNGQVWIRQYSLQPRSRYVFNGFATGTVPTARHGFYGEWAAAEC
jgi:hypothetical protein